jgi:hypothetical protein
MGVKDGSFYIAMAFDAEDKPVARVGQGHGIRMHDTIGKAKAQRKRWINGTRYYRGSTLHNHFPNAKVFQLTYVAGVLMATEVDCDV